MRAITLVTAALEGALVLFWLTLTQSAIGTPHQFWYFILPLAFLVVPGIAIAVALRVGKATLDRHYGWYYSLMLALVLNIVAFVFYAALSRGGV